MRSARSSAARTAGSSAATMTVAAPDVEGALSGALIGREAGRPGAPRIARSDWGVPVRTSRSPQGTSKARISVSEETPAAPAPGGREGYRSPEGFGRLVEVACGSVRAGAELDLDLGLVAGAADGQGHLVAGLLGVD